MPIDLSKYGLLVSDADKQQALYQGLLGLGSQLMAGSAPSLQPGGGARGFAAGGQAFQQGYQGHINNTLGRQMQGMQVATAQQQMEAQKQKAEREQAQILAQQRYAQARAMGGRDIAGNPVDMRGLLFNADPGAIIAGDIKAMNKEPTGDVGQFTSAQDLGLIPPNMSYQEYVGMMGVAKSPKYYIGQNAGMSPQDVIKMEAGKAGAVKRAEYQAKSETDHYDKIRSDADTAMRMVDTVRMQAAIPVKTGAFEEEKALFNNIMKSVGIDLPKTMLDQTSDVQSFRSIQERLVNSQLMAAQGVQTEGDAQRARRQFMQISNLPDANRFIANMLVSENERKIYRAEFYEQGRANLKSRDALDREWRDYIRSTPMFGTNPNTQRPVFISEFIREVRRANPGASRDEIVKMWRQKYGRAD